MRKGLFIGVILLNIFSLHAREYLIGRDPTWFPYDLKAKNAYVNLFINTLFDHVSSDNTAFLIYDVAPLSLIQGLQEGNYEGIVTLISPNEESTLKFDFSHPILLLGPVLVTSTASSAHSLSDLCGQRIGISAYDNSELIIQKYPSLLMKKYDNMAIALEDLSRGDLDAVLMDIIDAQGIIKSLYLNKLHIVSEPLNRLGIYLIVLQEKHTELLSEFNKKLKEFLMNHSIFKCLN